MTKKPFIEIAKSLLNAYEETGGYELTSEEIDDLTSDLNMAFKVELGLITDEELNSYQEEAVNKRCLRHHANGAF